MQRQFSLRIMRGCLLAVTFAALLFTAGTRISGTGGLTLMSTAVVNTPNDAVGTGAAYGSNGIYFSAASSINGDFDALAGRFASPLADGASPTWSQSWPPAGGFDAFMGVDAGSDGVYFAGSSYSQTTDVVGGKERKEIVAKFNLTGAAGGDTGGAVWVGRQRFYPASNSYDGDEFFNVARVSVEGGATYLYGGGHAQNNGCNNNYAIRKYTDAGATVWQWQQIAGACGGSDINAIAVDGTNVYAAGSSSYAGNLPQILRFSAANGSAGPSATFSGTLDAGYTGGAYTSIALAGGNIYAAGYLSNGERQAYLLDEWNASGTRLLHQVWSSDATKTNGQQLTGLAAVGSRLFAVGWTRNLDAPAAAHNMGGDNVALFPNSAAYHGYGDGVIFELDPATGAVVSTTSYGANDSHDQAFTSVATDGTDLYVVGAERGANGFYHVIAQRYALAISTTLAAVSGSGSYGGPATLRATLSSSAGAVSGATVSFTLSGSAVGSAVTDANGMAQLANVSLAGVNAGSYPAAVAATFTATGNFVGSSAAGDLTVDKAGASIAVTGGGTFTYDGQPHAAAGSVKGVFNESLGPAAITYTDLAANTTSAAAPVSGGSYRVNASFAGSANYLAGSNSSVVLTINPAATSTTLQTWGTLATAGSGPAFGSYGSAEFHDGAGRAIVVTADSSNPFVLNNANGLGGVPTWTSYVASGHPVQKNAAAAYDPASNTLMMYGGCGGGCLPITNQVWVLTHANGVGGAPAWINRTPGANPSARQSMASGYDPVSNRLIVFGGQDGGGSGGSTLPDVWALTNANGTGGASSWTQLLPDNAPPPGQWAPSSWFDSASNRLIVAGGGAQGSGTATRAVWALTNANGVSGTPHWINLIPEGATGGPNGFIGWPAAYDPATNRALLFENGTSNLWIITNANGLGGTPAYNHVTLTGGPSSLTNTLALPYDAATHRVTAIPNASAIVVLGSADGIGAINPAATGQPVTFTATVSPIAPGTGTRTGTVTFNDGATVLGTAAVNAAGQAIFTISSLSSAGSPHAITALYNGDSNFAISTSAVYSQTITAAATTTGLAASLNPSVVGQSVTFTATVVPVAPATGTPTGAVTFKDGAATLGTGAVNGAGQATFATSALAIGGHSITAVYGGDANFSTSTSLALSQTVAAAATTTGVVSSANPASFGQSVTLTATVSAIAPGSGIPTGAVTFKDGAATLGSGALNAAGQATFSTTALSVGSHSITVVYGGDTNFTTSTSPILTETVNPIPTATSLTVLTTAWQTKAPMPTARNGAAAGVIDGVVYVAGGWFGSHLLTVEAYNPATNAWATKGNRPSPQTHAASGVINGKLYTAGGTDCCVEVSTLYEYNPASDAWTSKPPMPTTRQDATGGVVNNRLYVAGGINSVGAGAHGTFGTLEEYDPASNTWATKASMPTARRGAGGAVVGGLFYVIGGLNAAGTAVLNTVEAYDPATNTWTTKAPMPTARHSVEVQPIGNLLFAIGGDDPTNRLDAVEAYDPSTNTWATYSAIPTARNDFVTASVNGTIYAIGGTSDIEPSGTGANEAYAPPAPPTTSMPGQNITLTATVNTIAPGSGTAAGTVTFRNGAAIVGTAALNARGVATLTIAAPAAGTTYTFTADYAGAGNFAASTSAPASHTVAATTTTTLASAPNPSLFAQSVTLTATVTSSSGTPTGTVDFKEGGTTLGSGTLSGGVATLVTSSLSLGLHSITAVYSGDTNFPASASSALSHTVDPAPAPTAILAANPNPAACSQSLTFDGTGSHASPGLSIVGYAWNFGDGMTGSGSTTTHAYSAFGTYLATLTVTDNNMPAKTGAVTVAVTVNQGNVAPVANHGGPYVADLGGTVTLSGAGSSDPNASCGDSIDSYAWSVGNGTITLAGAVPTLTAAQVNALGAGTFPVSLSVTDSFGLTNTAATTLTVYNNVPTAAFSATPNPAGCSAPILFDAGASQAGRPDRAIGSYAWNFGDGTTGVGSPATHAYNGFGSYTATLTVTDTNVPAKTASVSHTISVSQGNLAPVAAAGGPYVAVLGNSVALNGAGSADPNSACGDRIVSYSWSIDGGALTLTGPSPSLSGGQVSALGAGSHTVSLTVRDTFGAAGSAATTLTLLYADDGDGIPGNPDAAGNAGIDTQPQVFSNGFDDRLPPGTGTTFGTILNRAGWNVVMSNLPDPAGVQATISGGGSGAASITACGGYQKQVLLDAAGETADFTCIGPTTISVTARTALPAIEVQEVQPQSFTCTFAGGIFLPLGLRNQVCNRINYIVARLATGNTVSMGSPVTADPANLTPVLVELLDDHGVIVGSMTLEPGASVDVVFGHDELTDATTAQLTLLAGTATATVSGVTQPLTGQPQTFLIDTTPPTIGPVSNITATATSTDGAVVNYPMPTATDNVPGQLDVTGNPPSGSVFPHGQTTVTITARDTAGNVATTTFTVTVQPGLLSIDVTPHDASRHPGQGGQPFTATGTFSQGPPQILGSGGGGSGGGFYGPNPPMWQVQFIPAGDFSACATPQYPLAAVGTNWTSQNFFDMNGTVQQIWSAGTPVVNVQGTITGSDVALALACTSGAATGTIAAHWTGTRYDGTMTFNGGSNAVSITGWSQQVPMTAGRFGVAAAALGGKVFAIGGVASSCNTPAPCSAGPLATVESYDAAAGVWTMAAPLSIGRESAAAATLGGTLYVIGGHMPGGLATGAVEVLNPAISSAWTTLPEADWMPTARAGLALVSDGRYLYAFGGNTQSGNGGATGVVERYDPSAPSGSRWTTLAAMPAPGNAAGGVLNGTIVIVGSDGSNRTDVYDIAGDTWHAGAPMPAPRGSMAAAVANGGLWLIGGTTNASLNYDTWVYYPATPRRAEGWAGVGSMPTARWALGAAVIGDVVYAVGGAGNVGASGEFAGLTTYEALSTPPFDDLSTGGGSGGGTVAVQWQSTNPLVADIDAGGVATPHAPGTTTIVASVGGISGQTTFTVVNARPVVEITGNLNGGSTTNGPFTMSEGSQALQLRANAQDPDNDPLTYAWSIVSGGGVLGSQFGGANSQSVSYANADGPATAIVQVVVTDSFGASATATATIAVNNLPPQLSMPNVGTVTTPLGSAQNFACASFTDAGVNDSPWTATVDYGDGGGAQPAALNVPGSCGGPGGPGGPIGALTLAHAYNRAGVFSVTVAVTDKDGGVGTGTMIVTVNTAFTSMNLTSSKPSNAVYGDDITFTATVTGVNGAQAPTGSVTFTIDGNQASAQTVSLNGSGQASISTSTLSATPNSNHSIVAVYSGDSNYQAASRNTTQFIGKANAGGSLVSSSNPSTYGQNVTFTVTLTGRAGVPGPTGTVTFSVDGSARPPQPLNASGQASFSINSLNAFGHNVSANYSGDSNFQNKFQSIQQTVNKATPIVTVTATPNPSTAGGAVTLQADVTSLLGSPNGNITFFDGAPQASPSLSPQLLVTIDPLSTTQGTVTFTTSALSAGAHTISASYSSGNSNLNSTIGSTPVTVNLPPAPPFSLISPTPAGACICTPFVDVGTGAQYWYAMADGSGQLTVTLVGHPSSQAGTINATIYDAGGVPVTQMSVSLPAGFDLPDVRASRTVTPTTVNAIYRIEVSSPTAAFGPARYWMRFDGALEAAVNSPTFPAFERGWAQWVLNADSGDTLNVRIFSAGTPQPPAGQPQPETVTFQWIAPDGTRSPAQPQALGATMPPGIDQMIPPPASAAPGNWTLVLNSSGPYRLEKTGGADRGIYLNSRTAGFGSAHVRVVDAHGNPFTEPVTFHVTSNDISEGGDSFTTNQGGFDATDIPIGPTFHLQVEGPFGLTVTPAQFDVTLSSCGEERIITIVVADTTPPSITAPANVTAEATSAAGAIVNPGEATASDLVSAVTVTRTPAGSQFALGTTRVVWTATDAAGNSSTATQLITVVDTTPPTLTAPADVTAEATSAAGAIVNPGQATASDLVSAVTVTRTPAGNQFALGTTSVVWSATDAAGNSSLATQHVTVVDTTPPTLTLLGPNPMTVEAGATFTDPGATATDTVAGPLTAAIQVTGAVNAAAVGSYTLTYTVSDGYNTTTATRTVKVVDTTPPTLTVPADLTAEATSAAGAIVNPGQATASDLVSAVTVTRTPAGNQFALGTTSVVWRATDAAGNSSTATQHITVVDTTKPTLALPADITVDATSPAGAVVTYTVSATDIVNGAVTVTCVRASGSTFPIGTSTVNCSAADASGNVVSCSFRVLVQAAAAQVNALISQVQSFNLAQGIENSLDSKLQNVLAALNSAKGGDASSVCGQMGAFINETTAQSGKKLTVSQADQLIAAGQRIRAVLGCQ